MNREELLKLIDRAMWGKWIELDLRNRGLTELPPEIGRLTSLQYLNLSGNQLITLPPEISQLTDLQQLNLYHNQFSNFPKELWELKTLWSLNLSFNQLTMFIPEIGQLFNLRKLILSGNQLVTITPEIGQLTDLQFLDLNQNNLSTLCPEINKLINLQSFILYENNLTTLPPGIGQLSALTSLDMSHNQLIALPSEIGQLETLTSLNISQNQLTTLPPEIGQLTALSALYINQNRLTTLPPEIGKLGSLESLDIGHNHLSTLPPEIGELGALRFFSLQNNKLKSLPKEIEQLTILQSLDLRSNPLLPLPPEIVERRNFPEAIIQAYLDYLTGHTRPLHETKLVLVGEGSVGKTSLVNRLLYDIFDPQSGKTEGIAIHRWYPSLPIHADGDTKEEETIQVNIWDFGGQEIMHATHQFFLTKRTLYVLVLDNRYSEVENRLDYWLTLIRSFGGESPILIVGNKCDQHPLDLDRRGLLDEHRTVRAIVDTSCKTGDGIADLRAAIAEQVAQMPHVNDPIVATWFEVKAELEEMDADTIPYHRYIELCHKHNVGNPSSQRVLLGFLHDLGVVLHFPDPRLETTNILNPEWVTRGVYRILNTRLPFAEAGLLTWEMLARILDDEPYQEKRMFIIDMMQKFELCYELPDQQHTYLLPDLLPKEAPETGDWADALRFEFHYPVLPGSILTRLIVRMHRHVHTISCGRRPRRATRLAWRAGVVLACEGNQALVRADQTTQRITLAIRGPGAGRRDLLTRIREHLGAIHASIADLRPAAKLPVPGHPEIPPVDYAWLREMERKGVPEFYPPGLTAPISVSQLLNGVEPPAARRRRDAKYEVHFHRDGQIGNIGDDAHVEGGINFGDQ